MSHDPGAPEVVHIFVAPKRGAPMKAEREAQAVADTGLTGDRYARAGKHRSGEFQVTLIELENLEEFIRATGLALDAEAPRRNIVTRGVRLNDLVGRRFNVGAVSLEGIMLCEPCSLFARRTYREATKFFAGKGGLCARILSTGVIRVGDRIDVT
jgi:MOSC domain-containing protein YiiM